MQLRLPDKANLQVELASGLVTLAGLVAHIDLKPAFLLGASHGYF